MKNKPPRDSEFGFRHLIFPLLAFFAAVPFAVGACASSISKTVTFEQGFGVGVALLAFGLFVAFGVMIRRRT